MRQGGRAPTDYFQIISAYRSEKTKNTDTAQFIRLVCKYSEIPKLAPEMMHECIEKIIEYAPDKSSRHRIPQTDISFRCNVAVATAIADSMIYDKKEKGCAAHCYAAFRSHTKYFCRIVAFGVHFVSL